MHRDGPIDAASHGDTPPGAAASITPRRRKTLAGAASLAVHGAAVVALGLFAPRATPAPRPAPIEIEVVAASPVADAQPIPQPIRQPSPPAVRPPSAAPLQGRRGQAAAPRVPSRPASVRTALADLTVRYDSPNFAASADTAGDGEHGRARLGQGGGIGQLHADLPQLAVPPPPGSLARPPRPRRDYHRLRLHAVRQYAGRSIKVLLSVDEHGRVRDVRLIQGVDADLDQRTIALTRNFEFEPALDETGSPVPGHSRWEIAIVDESNEGLRDALRRGYY